VLFESLLIDVIAIRFGDKMLFTRRTLKKLESGVWRSKE